MLIESQEDRETRFKAMLQYLILREACEFDDKFPGDDSGAGAKDGSKTQWNEDKVVYSSESAKKILREMELKFYDLFVEDDLVGDYLFFDVLGKQDVYKKKDNFKVAIQEHISNKITVINSTDVDIQNHKESLKKIVQSPIIENLIMTCDLSIKSKESYLISDINNVFNSSNLASIKDNSLVKIRDEFLSESNNECCKIPENSIAIHAHLKTATALSLGFLNLTEKIITKALGDLSGVLLENVIKSDASPSESVRGNKINAILEPFKTATQDYI